MNQRAEVQVYICDVASPVGLGCKPHHPNARVVLEADHAAEVEKLQSENAALRQHISEWLCRECNTVHIPPSGFNLSCPTPGCIGLLAPSSYALRKVETERDEARAMVEAAGVQLAEVTRERDAARSALIDLENDGDTGATL